VLQLPTKEIALPMHAVATPHSDSIRLFIRQIRSIRISKTVNALHRSALALNGNDRTGPHQQF
jgi:hypothetical protein